MKPAEFMKVTMNMPTNEYPSPRYKDPSELPEIPIDPAQHMELVRRAVVVLNRALAVDPYAVDTLFESAVGVRKILADDPTVQILVVNPAVPEPLYQLRPMGLINGLFGVDDTSWGFIAMEMASLEPFHIGRFMVRLGDGGPWWDAPEGVGGGTS